MAKTLDMHTEQSAILERMLNAHAKVQDRLLRVARLLGEAGIPYAVIGGNAVAAWVATKDESLVRATRDVDILLRKEDLPHARMTLEADGFVFRHAAGIDMFLDGATGKAGDGVHLIYAGQPVSPRDSVPAPDVSDGGLGLLYRVLALEDLVRTKLVAWRRKDQVHLLDMIGVGLLDPSWPERYPEPLRSRLQELIDNPE